MSPASSNTEPSRFRQFFKLNDFDLSIPVTSNFVSPRTLLLVRAFFATYALIVIISEFVISFPNPLRNFFSYFTNLTYLGLTGYLCAATYHSFRYCRQGNDYLANSRMAKSSLALFFYWLAYQCITVYHIVVPAVFWATLYSPGMTMSTIVWWTTTSRHGADFVFMFTEFILCRWTFELPYVPLILGIAVLYMFWSWIIYAIYDIWVYGFLNWGHSPGVVVGSYLGVAAAFFLVAALMYGLHRLRERIARKYVTHDNSSTLYIINDKQNDDVEMGQHK